MDLQEMIGDKKLISREINCESSSHKSAPVVRSSSSIASVPHQVPQQVSFRPQQ